VSAGRIRWGRVILALLFLGAVVYGGWRLIRRRSSSAPAAQTTVASAPADARAPAGVRIKIEVLNATSTRGLARRAALFLRDRGFDVVGTGTVKERRDSTLVLDRSGHAAWAQLVGKALNARVEARPDSSRYLDITVLLGGNWRPPALPFYP
jgi:hypothetical protein